MNLCRITLSKLRNKRTVKVVLFCFWSTNAWFLRVRNVKRKTFLLSGLKVAARTGFVRVFLVLRKSLELLSACTYLNPCQHPTLQTIFNEVLARAEQNTTSNSLMFPFMEDFHRWYFLIIMYVIFNADILKFCSSWWSLENFHVRKQP